MTEKYSEITTKKLSDREVLTFLVKQRHILPALAEGPPNTTNIKTYSGANVSYLVFFGLPAVGVIVIEYRGATQELRDEFVDELLSKIGEGEDPFAVLEITILDHQVV